MWKRLLRVVVVVPICGACGPVAKNATPLPERPSLPSDNPVREYTIERGDRLDIKFFYNPELDEEITVRPDGRISLRLVPEVVAWGKTARELDDLLTELYSKELLQPDITVIVDSFSAQRIFVTGEVGEPGQLELLGATTVTQAVAAAGGLLSSAREAEVIVIRRNPDRTPRVMQVNLQAAMNGADLRQDIDLQPYDVVYVPRSTIANVNKWVDLYLRQNIPVNFGFRLDLTPR